MSAPTEHNYQSWLQSRIRSARVASIDLRLRVVSTNLLKTCGPEILELVDKIDLVDQAITRRDLALYMREVLDQILPKVLESPDWLLQALNDFSDNEIIELYNVTMYGVDPEFDDLVT